MPPLLRRARDAGCRSPIGHPRTPHNAALSRGVRGSVRGSGRERRGPTGTAASETDTHEDGGEGEGRTAAAPHTSPSGNKHCGNACGWRGHGQGKRTRHAQPATCSHCPKCFGHTPHRVGSQHGSVYACVPAPSAWYEEERRSEHPTHAAHRNCPDNSQRRGRTITDESACTGTEAG